MELIELNEEICNMLMESAIDWDPPDTSPTPPRRPPSPREDPVEALLRTQAVPLFKRSASTRDRRRDSPPFLLRFLQEAESSYTHLVEHVDDDIREERILSITDIGAFWDKEYECDPYAEEIAKRYGEPLKRAYSVWLQCEHACGHLVDRSYWQVYRDPRNFVAFYLGYRRLFVYQQHSFQVIYESDCFYLTLYGGAEEDLMPECHWFHSV